MKTGKKKIFQKIKLMVPLALMSVTLGACSLTSQSSTPTSASTTTTQTATSTTKTDHLAISRIVIRMLLMMSRQRPRLA